MYSVERVQNLSGSFTKMIEKFSLRRRSFQLATRNHHENQQDETLVSRTPLQSRGLRKQIEISRDLRRARERATELPPYRSNGWITAPLIDPAGSPRNYGKEPRVSLFFPRPLSLAFSLSFSLSFYLSQYACVFRPYPRCGLSTLHRAHHRCTTRDTRLARCNGRSRLRPSSEPSNGPNAVGFFDVYCL